MQLTRHSSLLGLMLFFMVIGAAPITQPAYLAPDAFDFKTLLGDPPADGSDGQMREIEALLQLQEKRTPEEIERCRDEVNAGAFIFADVMGKWFNPKDLPATAALMKELTAQTRIISSAAKINWNRKRPYVVDDRIKPCVELEKSFSYPSGHATRGIVWATILSEIFPQHRGALMARGREFGIDRSIAGVHYPSDVAAGQKLGAEIARRMLADPDVRERIAKAKEQSLAAAHH
ncbi:MAG TPA: phosphatase PAP2 family protein [Tepidisphaeraceae bacterium]|jgi:hypothetical protein|nr:phosphatase PAP2 family protein [Tepidisphaeraceae bacterium]